MSRVALHLSSPHPAPLSVAQQDRVVTARTFCSSLLTSSLHTHQKVQSFERLWPEVVGKLVHSVVQEYSDIDHNMDAMLQKMT